MKKNKQITNYINENLKSQQNFRFVFCKLLICLVDMFSICFLSFKNSYLLCSIIRFSWITNKFQKILISVNKKTIFFSQKLIIAILLLMIINFNAYSQTNNILNFQMDGFYLLPSESGTHNNKWVLSSYINSKTILKEMPIRSYVILGDYRIKRGLQSLYIGVSFGAIQLMTSPYHENEFYSTIAYHKIIKNHTLHIGVQTGLLFRNLDFNSLVFPDQYDRGTGTFNPRIPTDEPVDFAGKAANINLNFGIAYGLRFNKFYSKLIIAARNINKPNLSFSQNPIIQSQQWILQTKTNYYFTNTNIVKSFLMLSNTNDKAEVFIGGELVHKLIRHNVLMNEVSVGSYIALRNNKYPNNIIFNMALGINNTKIGFAYAYNFVGTQASANNFNTFEIVLLFIGLNNILEYYSVPCEIY